jgi:hypothetical protein
MAIAREASDNGWTAEEVVSSYGVRLRVRVTDPVVLPLLRERLPSGWKPSTGRPSKVYSLVVADTAASNRSARHVLYADDLELIRSRRFPWILDRFETAARIYVAEETTERTFVHAGVVAWEGRAIVIPGIAGSGKTTLTAALVRAGAGYLSDEYALIDDRGWVHPFPKPLFVRKRPDRQPVREPVEKLGGVQLTKPLPIGLVVFASYGARRWRPRRLSPGEAVLELLKHTLSGQRRPHEAVHRLGQVAAAAPVLKGARGEAEVSARQILAMMTGGSGVREGRKT